MALATAYATVAEKKPIHTLILAHFDAHGVLTGAARMRVLREAGEDVAAIIQYPDTGPVGLSSGRIRELVEQSMYGPQHVELIDIPLDVRNVDASVRTLIDLAQHYTVYMYDHHETDMPHVQRLLRNGIIAVVVESGVALATVLGLMGDSVARELAIVGIVADRDSSILSIVDKSVVEQRYLPLANTADVVVRAPQQHGFSSLVELAERLAVEGVSVLERIPAGYPPYEEARKAVIVEEGSAAILADFENVASQWAPKTAEAVLQMRGRDVIVFVAPAIDPRTRQQVGWDVRMLRYWLSDWKVELAAIARDEIKVAALQGNVVGHGDYVSIRLPGANKEQAMNLARRLYERVEGRRSSVAHLVNDNYVARAINRDYSRIIELLERIARALERGSEAKEEQVQLLKELYRRDERTRYD